MDELLIIGGILVWLFCGWLAVGYLGLYWDDRYGKEAGDEFVTKNMPAILLGPVGLVGALLLVRQFRIEDRDG